jgi:hypothetical protein
MSPKYKHNLLVAPIVLLVRLPLLLPLWLLARIGELAEGAGEAIGGALPGFRR